MTKPILNLKKLKQRTFAPISQAGLALFLLMGGGLSGHAQVSLPELQARFQALKKEYLQEGRFQVVAYYRFADPVQDGKQKLSYRALVLFLDEQGHMARELFLDRFRRIEQDLKSGEKRVLLDWDSFYWRQGDGTAINLNDQGRDGLLEAANNQPDNQNLALSWSPEGFPEVRDQVLTCATNTQVKGLGTKSWQNPPNFIYRGRYFQDCPEREPQFEAVYEAVSQAEGEQVFLSL